jgi:ribosomal protein S18 acetylase RimI-like enzyme
MSTDGISLKPVSRYLDAMVMRGIRNECRGYMTNNTSHITVRQQSEWWGKVKHDPSWLLYLLYHHDVAVGYGIVRIRDGQHWVTGGLIASARGHGLGRFLFARLTEIASADHCAYLEVRRDNHRAINLYSTLGYRYLGESRPDILLMRTTPG